VNLLKGSAVLKLVALLVALLTYGYIHNEIYNGGKNEKAVDPSYKLIKLTAKNLPVKVRLNTAPPSGYRLAEEGAMAMPRLVTVIGPEALLEDALTAETSMIDVSEYSKPVIKQVPLENVAGIHLTGQPYLIEVTIPIEKIPAPETAAELSAASPSSASAPTAP
jgi:YbbR domain-containing protein